MKYEECYKNVDNRAYRYHGVTLGWRHMNTQCKNVKSVEGLPVVFVT